MPYEDLVADASPEVQEFERQLVAWADENGWVTRTTAASRQVADARTGRGIAFYPVGFPEGGAAVEVSLTPLYECGLAPLAEHILERLNAIAAEPLTDRSPKVPVSTVLEHWDHFFERILPASVLALASADAAVARRAQSALQ
jgi:hypothetical protein